MSEELPVPEVVLVLESVLAFEVLLVEELEPEFSVLSNEEVSELLTLSIPDIGSLLTCFYLISSVLHVEPETVFGLLQFPCKTAHIGIINPSRPLPRDGRGEDRTSMFA